MAGLFGETNRRIYRNANLAFKIRTWHRMARLETPAAME